MQENKSVEVCDALNPVIHIWIDSKSQGSWLDRSPVMDTVGLTACGIHYTQKAGVYPYGEFPLCPECIKCRVKINP